MAGANVRDGGYAVILDTFFPPYQPNKLWFFDRFVEDKEIRCACFSPDANCIAAGLNDGTVSVLDIATGEETARLDNSDYRRGRHLRKPNRDESSFAIEYEQAVTSLCFSPDGTHIAFGNLVNEVTVWETETDLVSSHRGHVAPVTSISFTPDGTSFFSGDQDGRIKRWVVNLADKGNFRDSETKDYVVASDDRSTYETHESNEMYPYFKFGHYVSPCVSVNGESIAAIVGARLYLWDTKSQQLIAKTEFPPGDLGSLPVGCKLSTGSTGLSGFSADGSLVYLVTNFQSRSDPFFSFYSYDPFDPFSLSEPNDDNLGWTWEIETGIITYVGEYREDDFPMDLGPSISKSELNTRWAVLSREDDALLVDREFRSQTHEETNSQRFSKINPPDHAREFEAAWKRRDYFAAALHISWCVKESPNSYLRYIQLRCIMDALDGRTQHILQDIDVVSKALQQVAPDSHALPIETIYSIENMVSELCIIPGANSNSEALTILEKALMAKNSDLTNMRRYEIYSTLGKAYFWNENYQAAIEACKNSVDVQTQLRANRFGDLHTELDNYAIIAMSHLHLGNHDEAKRYRSQHVITTEEYDNPNRQFDEEILHLGEYRDLKGDMDALFDREYSDDQE